MLAAVGCSSGEADLDEPAGAAPPAAVRAPPLVAQDGTVLPPDPSAVPVDAGAWTQASQYATRGQAAQLGQTLGGRVVEVEVGCCGAEAVDLAVWTTFALRAAHDLPATVPVFVSGRDLRLAAVVANRLGEHGMPRVFLVSR